MPVPKKVLNLLKKSKVSFEILKHKKVFSAFDKSQTLKLPQKLIGKTLVLKIKKGFAIALISADKKLDLRKLKKLGKNVKLAKEASIKRKFKGVKVGAIPPFGNLWKIPTFVDLSLKRQKEIILNGGDWQNSIKLKTKDLKKIVPDLVFLDLSK